MNERLISIFRTARSGTQILAEPFDCLYRHLTHRGSYPPLWVRQKVGDIFDFETSGAEYMAYLKLLCGLKRGDKILDIGCGCGVMCLRHNENPPISDYLGPGGFYLGVDSDKQLVDWCRKNLSTSNVRFDWLPHGSPQDLEVGSSQFNVVLCKSLFTHLFPSEFLDYLSAIEDCLVPNGRVLLTLFILNGQELKGRYTFKYKSETYSLERQSRPQLAIAYDGEWLLEVLKASGYSYEIYHGSWRGDSRGLSFQDIVIIRKGE